MRDITVRYSAIDGFAATRRFKTLAGAQKFAQRYVGEHPEYFERSWYAVSFDGVGKVTVDGATLAEVFPPRAEPKCPSVIPSGMYWDEVAGRLEFNPNESGYIAMQGDPMAIYEREDGDYDENAPCPSKGATHDTPESLSADGGLRWPDDCPF